MNILKVPNKKQSTFININIFLPKTSSANLFLILELGFS